MSRPALPGKERRSRYVVFRVTDDEYQKLSELSKTLGKATGELIREKLFKGRFPSPKLSRLDALTYAELKRIGTNVNQVARKINGGKYPPELEDVFAELIRYEKIIVTLLLDHDRHTEDR